MHGFLVWGLRLIGRVLLVILSFIWDLVATVFRGLANGLADLLRKSAPFVGGAVAVYLLWVTDPEGTAAIVGLIVWIILVAFVLRKMIRSALGKR